MLDEILKYNQNFVKNLEYMPYATSKYPDKKLAIVTCMDTRLTKLLPAALGIANGDAKIIKNAGGVITHPFGSAMRSLLLAVYELEVSEILVIGHTDCGACHADGKKIIDTMHYRGITQQKIDMINYFGINLAEWMDGFQNLESSVTKSCEVIRQHPLIPDDVEVYGLIIDSSTGELSILSE